MTDALPPLNASNKPRVVIVGGGFAGLAAAQKLKRVSCEVTLVDRRNFHLFQPLLYQVATGELSPSNIAAPLRGILSRQKNTAVELGEIVDLDLNRRRVRLEDRELAYDYLIMAAGSMHHYFGNEAWSEWAPGLKTVENATEIRRRILTAFEAAERSDHPDEVSENLTFVIVGAGPTGVELAGALAEVAYRTLAGDFRKIDPKQAKILLVDPSEQPLDFYPAPLPEQAAHELEELGVQIMRGFHVTDVNENSVTLHCQTRNEDTIVRTRTVIWAAGVKASPLGRMICEQAGVQPGRGGRVPVQQDGSVEGYPNVFVCGDMSVFIDPEKGELPGLAPVAGQMGHHAARCIDWDLKGKARKRFRYFDKGSLAVIGRFRAVGTIGKLKLHGIIAWAIWLFIHLLYITRFRNRVLVLTQWGWTFFTHDRSSRLITGAPAPRSLHLDQVVSEYQTKAQMPESEPISASSSPQQ